MHQLIRDILIEADVGTEPRFWYMSFCDAERPEGQQFLGSCFVAAKTLSGALTASHRLKCNPGGEVKFYELPPGTRLPAKWLTRLLAKDELDRMDNEFLDEGVEL